MRVRPKNDFIVSLGFADYLRARSGMPKVIMEHQQMYNAAGISYVYLFSVKKNIFRDRFMLFCKFGLIIDGRFCGIYQMSQILRFLETCMESGKKPLDLHVHHLLYVNLRRAEELFAYLKWVPKKVFLHDFYNACTSYNLMYNGTHYCGGRGLSPEFCHGCASFEKSLCTQKKLHDLYGKYLEEMTFVAPSRSTREIFLRYHPEYASRTVVVPHQKMDGEYAGNLEQIPSEERLRIAFLGMPAPHKGWNLWSELVRRAPEEEYAFFVFNSSGDKYEGMTTVPVSYGAESLDAMTEALRKHKIHMVLLWATWPETYSYTCFEAFAANAYLLTGTDSGNIVNVIDTYHNGTVLEDQNRLLELFDNPRQVRTIVNAFRSSAVCGPERLIPNTQIVEMTLSTGNAPVCQKGRRRRKPVNYPLLWLLRWIYK